MKIPAILFLLPFLVQTGWTEFKSYDGNFRVLCPGELTEKIDTIDTEVGEVAYHTFVYQPPERDAANLVYLVSYCDYPEGIVFADSTGLVDDFFQETMDAAAFSIDGELMYSTDIQLDTFPGKLWRIDYLNGQAVIKTKAYLVGNRYYSLQTVTSKSRNINPASETFFDSFRLL